MSSLFDAEDDLSLRTRRSAEEGPVARERSVAVDDPGEADREVTLNTGTVLALFFTLALICAVFFGFGYSMGRKSNQAAPVATATDGAAAEATTAPVDTASSKPAPGSPAIQPIPGYLSSQEADASNKTPTHTASAGSPPAVAAAPRPAVKEPATTTAATAAPVAHTPAAAAPAISTAPAAAGETYVQIAAVSHQEDADVLKSALGRRGYKVVERSDGNDHLIHVQIGPFTDRKAAEATRQKLLSDGYNAFLK